MKIITAINFVHCEKRRFSWRKFIYVWCIVGSAAFSFGADFPANNQLGIGPTFISPTGLTAKYWLTKNAALDGALGWSFTDADRFQAHADYLWHFQFQGLKSSTGNTLIYSGLGLRVTPGGRTNAGIRIPFGLSYLPESLPMEFFGEVAPIDQFTPDGRVRVDGGFGVRYYFK